MVCIDVKVTNCYLSIFSLSYKRFSLKNVEGGTTVWSHVFRNFQVPKILEKEIMQKNRILYFFEMSAFETE